MEHLYWTEVLRDILKNGEKEEVANQGLASNNISTILYAEKLSSFLTEFEHENRFVQYVNPQHTKQRCIEEAENSFAFVTITVSSGNAFLYKRDVATNFGDRIAAMGGSRLS